MAFFSKTPEQHAEAWLREGIEDNHITAYLRHYPVSDVVDRYEDATGKQISDEEMTRVVAKLRDECGIRPLEEHEMAGYVSPEDIEEDRAATQAYYDQRSARRAGNRNNDMPMVSRVLRALVRR